MSRAYNAQITLTLTESQLKRRAEIEAAAQELWAFDSFDYYDVASNPSGVTATSSDIISTESPTVEKSFELTSYGEDSLCGGESEEEFVDRLSKELWKAADVGYFPVEVRMTYLEELPYEEHVRERGDYDELMKEEEEEEGVISDDG